MSMFISSISNAVMQLVMLSSYWLLTLSNILSFSQTPFVRQNTPHPKDLKAKAQKLLAGRSPEAAALLAAKQQETPTTNGITMSPPEQVEVPVETIEVSRILMSLFWFNNSPNGY